MRGEQALIEIFKPFYFNKVLFSFSTTFRLEARISSRFSDHSPMSMGKRSPTSRRAGSVLQERRLRWSLPGRFTVMFWFSPTMFCIQRAIVDQLGVPRSHMLISR
jgi:hypothetical protein